MVSSFSPPPKRLASDVEAKAWLDGHRCLCLRSAIRNLSGLGAVGAGGGGGGGAVINSEEFLKFQADWEKVAAQHVKLYMHYLGHNSRAGELIFDQEKANSIALQAKLDSITCEHGDTYIEGIQPCFDVLKARHFDSSWNWVRQDALLMCTTSSLTV